VPERVAEAIRQRLADLSESARAVLSAAAVIGRRFEVPLLERVIDGAPGTVSVELGAALDRGVLEADSSSHGTFQFSHILVRDVLYDDLPARRRAELHVRVGEALSDADGLALVPATLAHHFVRGALVGGYERAARYSVIAGRRALEAYAFSDAVAHFEGAVGMLRGQDATATSCDTLVLLGEARRLAGDLRGALDAVGEAMALAGSIADSVRFARAALERAILTPESGMTNRPVIDLLTGALSALDGSGRTEEPAIQVLRARILSRCAMSHAFADDLATAEAMSDQAVAIARAHRSPLPLIHALQAAHWVAWRPGTAEARLAATEEMLREARASGDESTVWESYQCRLTDLMELGRGTAFRRTQGELCAFFARTGDPRARWHAASMDAAIATMEGRFDDAAEHAAAALQIGRRIEEPNTMQFFGAQLWALRMEQGRADEVLSVARDIVLQNPGHVGYRASLLRTHAELEQIDAARAELERLADDLESLRVDWQLLPVLAHMAFGCDVVGDTALAAIVRDRLAPFSRYHVVLGPALIYHGPVSRYLARCERVQGRLDEAVRLLESARSESEEMGAPTTELACLRDLRDTLERRGRPEDQSRLAWARARAVELGGGRAPDAG
jgi:tetratricopeptide (TPR) repeat protein